VLSPEIVVPDEQRLVADGLQQPHAQRRQAGQLSAANEAVVVPDDEDGNSEMCFILYFLQLSSLFSSILLSHPPTLLAGMSRSHLRGTRGLACSARLTSAVR
jgi:hypothetical protein